MSLIENIKRDRERGTAGAWKYCPDEDDIPGHRERARVEVGRSSWCSSGQCGNDYDARRIARVPDMESAILANAEQTYRLDGVGEPFLWAIHVIGPDDVYPVASYGDAIEMCRIHNDSHLDAMEETGVAAIAVPTIWLGSAEDHAAALSSGATP